MDYLEQGKHFGESQDQLIGQHFILSKATVKPTAEIPWHYHENAYFLYNLRGSLHELTKHKSQIIGPGSLLYHHSQDPHCNKHIVDGAQFFHVELSPSWFQKYDLKAEAIHGNRELVLPQIKSIFNKIYLETGIKDASSTLAVDGLLLQAFSEILRLPEKDTHRVPAWTKKIIEIIAEERWEQLSLIFLANELGLHPVYLSRKFPIFFKMQLGDYIREQKLAQALHLLQADTLRNVELAYQCGFADESHFVRVFKAKFGITPFQYKKALRRG